MEWAKIKETLVSSLTRSKKRDEEAAADKKKDLISSLPKDLKLQILARVPPKSITKFIAVSKLWSSIVRTKDLTPVFDSRALNRPCFLFTYGTNNIQRFHSRSQEDPSSFGNNITTKQLFGLSQPVRGLICGRELFNATIVICNPSTGQFKYSPILKSKYNPVTFTYIPGKKNISNFIGYDPVLDQYKVLCIMSNKVSHNTLLRDMDTKHRVFTLGTNQKTWRKIECKQPWLPATNELCRDGVIYYGAWYYNKREEKKEYVIVSFDVRSEDFSVIKLPKDVKIKNSRQTRLVNYHGNMALVDRTGFTKTNVDLWVLMDVKKQEWCKISIVLPDVVRNWSNFYYCMGTISTGEIIFAPNPSINRYFLLYYDLKGDNARKVVIKGVKDGIDQITVSLDHVESLMFLSK